MGRVLRPLIIPDAGYGIGEADWSQIEVGISAAVYGDTELVRMFNSGDVYSMMAKEFYRDELSPDDRELSDTDFKRAHPALRERMKRCTLGIIYGVTPYGLARQLDTSKGQAGRLQKRFLEMFPVLKAALADAQSSGTLRGYAVTTTGLRRYRGRTGNPSRWELNWLTNHPIQGTAAVVFKAAGNRLDVLYRPYGAKLIIPLHDAFVFEAPLPSISEVADLTERVMCDVVREFFPELNPRAEVNISDPTCWNKEGQTDLLEKWLEDPTASG